MSHTISCDGGCGFTSSKDSDFEKLGVIIQKEYCCRCAKFVRWHLIVRDEFHDKLAKEWDENKVELKATFKEKLPNGELPDE